jgi:hypothetical protein
MKIVEIKQWHTYTQKMNTKSMETTNCSSIFYIIFHKALCYKDYIIRLSGIQTASALIASVWLGETCWNYF